MSSRILAPVFFALIIGFAIGFFLEPQINRIPPKPIPSPGVSARIFVTFPLPKPAKADDGSLKFDLSETGGSVAENSCEATNGTVTIVNGKPNYAIPKGNDAKGTFGVEVVLVTSSRTSAHGTQRSYVEFTPQSPLPPSQEYRGEATTQSQIFNDAMGGEIIESCET